MHGNIHPAETTFQGMISRVIFFSRAMHQNIFSENASWNAENFQ
jgi:hypothetical protein